ncbi:MAG: Ig-like domain-containing protein, partial [Pseudomonadota bacterium]
MMRTPLKPRKLQTSTMLAALLLAGSAFTQTASAAEYIEGSGWFFRSGQQTFVSFAIDCVGGTYKNTFQLQDATLDLRAVNGEITSVIGNGSDSRTLQGGAQIILSTGENTSGTFRSTITDSTDAIVVELSTGHMASSNLQGGDIAIRTYPSASCTVTGADNTAPSASMTSPATIGEVSGVLTMSASASDNSSGVAGVQFLVNGLPFGPEDTTAPYELTNLNTLTAANGTYILQAKVRDNAGNTARSRIVPVLLKNLSNPAPDTSRPSMMITSPRNNVTVSGSGTVQTAGSDTGSGIASVQFFIDGFPVGAADN